MDMILDIICRMSMWEMLGLSLICIYIIISLPEIAQWIYEKYEEYRRLDKEEYQPWMDKEKWNATGKNDYYMHPFDFHVRKHFFRSHDR